MSLMHDVLKEEHRALRQAVSLSRHAWKKSHSVLVRSIYTALDQWDTQKADGVPHEERAQYLERTVRACWPFVREWKYLCHLCNDTGLVMHECSGDATCGRGKPHNWHTYGVPCRCGKGSGFRPRTPTAEDFQQATRGRAKSRSFTKLGQR